MLEEGEAELRSGYLRYFESGGREAGPWMTCLSVSHLMGLQRIETFLDLCLFGYVSSSADRVRRVYQVGESQVTGSREGRLRRKKSECSHFSLT